MDIPQFLKKFCIIGLGGIEELKEELSVISESNINFISGEGLMVATFDTAFNLPEIEELLNMGGKSYIIFEMNIGFYSANIENKEFQNILFGGEIDSSKSPYFIMEETLKQIRDKIFFEGEDNINIKNINPQPKKSDEELLSEALKNEDYEVAVKLRDKIKNK